MGSKGGSGPTQTTGPWSGQEPFLRFGFNQARNLYNQGGPEYFPDSTYVPFSQQTENALGLTEQRALGGSPVTSAAQNLAAQSLGSRPDSSGVQNFINTQLSDGSDLNNFSQFANVGSGIPFGDAQQTFNSQLTGLPNSASNALATTAQGQNLNGNPYLDQQFDNAASRVTDTFNRDISPNIAAQFSLAGRTGSDAQANLQTRAAGEVSDSLASLASNIYGGNYQAERDRQLSAAGQLGTLAQNQQGLGLQAAGQGVDLYNTNQQQDISRRGLAGQLYNQQIGNQLSAAGLGNNLYGQQLGQQNTFAGLANSLANQDYFDLNQLGNVGGRVEGLGRDALSDRINRFNHNENRGNVALQNYIAAIQGNYGGTTASSGSDPNRFQGALGGALTGAQIGSIVPGIGTGIGAGVGGLLGLLG